MTTPVDIPRRGSVRGMVGANSGGSMPTTHASTFAVATLLATLAAGCGGGSGFEEVRYCEAPVDVATCASQRQSAPRAQTRSPHGWTRWPTTRLRACALSSSSRVSSTATGSLTNSSRWGGARGARASASCHRSEHPDGDGRDRRGGDPSCGALPSAPRLGDGAARRNGAPEGERRPIRRRSRSPSPLGATRGHAGPVRSRTARPVCRQELLAGLIAAGIFAEA